MQASANPVKPLLHALEDLDVYATAYRYPSPGGRIKQPPAPAAVDEVIRQVEREIATRFAIDLSKRDGPAGNVTPIR